MNESASVRLRRRSLEVNNGGETMSGDMMDELARFQAEMAALEANQEDDYANSAWANSGALKAHFSGAGNGGGISLGGIGGRSGFN